MKLFLRYIGLSLLCVILIANTGCGKEDAIEVQQDLYEVIVDKPVVRIGHNEEVNVNVMLGNGGYSVKSYNEQVATATVDGEQITIKSGIQNGATTVEVTDAEGIKTDISVNVGLFELEFNEQTIEMEVNEEKELIVDIVNLDGEKQQLGACSVGGVTLENMDKDNMVYQLPGKITVGESTLDDVLDAYGDPDDQYEEKDWVYVTYEYGIYKKADLVFDIEDEVLEKAVLKNYRDSEPEETSKDVPKEVSDYQAPEAFSENPLDFIVQFDGDFYQLPAPVSEFIKNGWKIDEEGSDTSVKAGRHGYVTLEKDGQTLYGVVNNYSKSAVPIKNSFLTNLHGDFDVTKVPIQIYRGITLGMNEESMKEALSDAKYETKEDEEGVSYYLYADEEKRDYVRIFVDKNLKLVREIELSNSPEGLEEKMLSEEDEKSVEASAMSGSDTLPEQE